MEPRIAAHFSEDPELIQIYRNGEDLYLKTVEIVGRRAIVLDEDPKRARDMAKILWLSILYQKSAYGLSHDWGCSETEAQAIIDGTNARI
jgi:DNA polymerase-1